MLEEIAVARFLDGFDDLGDLLGAIAGADEERVGSFDDDEIVDAEKGDEE